MKTKRDYNNLSDNKKEALRNYRSWSKSDVPIEYKLYMIEECYKVLVKLGIEKFVWND